MGIRKASGINYKTGWVFPFSLLNHEAQKLQTFSPALREFISLSISPLSQMVPFMQLVLGFSAVIVGFSCLLLLWLACESICLCLVLSPHFGSLYILSPPVPSITSTWALLCLWSFCLRSEERGGQKAAHTYRLRVYPHNTVACEV